MKKLFALLLVICLLISITACDDSSYSDSSSDYNSEESSYSESEDVNNSSDIPLQSVDSSCFSQVGYRNGTLVVVFHDSGPYQYTNIPESLYYDFINADSLGGFYNDYIKGQYPCDRL
jgi:uncharacterized protein YxeA